MQRFLSFFLLFSLFYRIKAECDNATEQRNIKSTLQFKNNLRKTPDKSTITTANTMDNNKPSGYEVENISRQKLVHGAKNNDMESVQHPRILRLAAASTNIECMSCTGAGTSINDDNCYNGDSLERTKCADAETCFTELHPQYIKRGCMLPSGLNRTFVCKCPLCNDKPAGDVTYYEYKTISDWQFDNGRLEEPILASELLCKVCETTGRNRVADKICANGSKADYMLCRPKHLCFTNINSQLDYVSRGCVDPPAYNSMYFFCNYTACNSLGYDNPARTKRTLEISLFKDIKRSSFASTMAKSERILLALNFLILFCSSFIS